MNNQNFEATQKQFTAWSEYLKSANEDTKAIINSLEIRNEEEKLVGYLVPMALCHADQDGFISKLTRWRNEHQYAYPSKFVATDTSTKLWFQKQVLENPNRMLFWIADSSLEFVGHLGVVLNTTQSMFEVDNVLRGMPSTPGIMKLAMERLEFEIEKEFSVEILSLRVLASNAHAIDFYKGMDYVELSKEALKWELIGGENRLIPGTPAEDHFLTLVKSLINLKPSTEKILTAGPSISTRESGYVFDATVNGWNSKHSKYIEAFESEFANYVGSKYAMATSSCSGALHLSLLALGIGPGDEVLVPEVTWVATASAVRYVGATPVFVDINPVDWTMSLDSLAKMTSSKTKAIIPVHLYGYGANAPAILAFANENNLRVIEDAAPAIGTIIEGKKAGTFGDFGCFSFQGAKLLVTGEGGMLVTDNPDLYAKAKKIQDHGRKPGTFWIEELGYKYKMNNITAALGLAQIHRSENQIFRKRRINSWYKENLSSLKGISFQEESPGTSSICWMTSILLDSHLDVTREQVMSSLAEFGIDSRPAFPAISQYTFWPTKQDPQPIGKIVGERAINLPSGVMLTRGQINQVSEALIKIIGEK
jgi:perosamine synthetase